MNNNHPHLLLLLGVVDAHWHLNRLNRNGIGTTATAAAVVVVAAVFAGVVAVAAVLWGLARFKLLLLPVARRLSHDFPEGLVVYTLVSLCYFLQWFLGFWGA